jgi:inhibitor of cysteine peptidase
LRSYDDTAQAIQVAAGEAFAVRLAGNPTTGYTWQASVDSSYLELVDQEFEPRGEGVGAGGHEVFRFRARATGETEIGFEYRRPWGGAARGAAHFRVVIG